MLNRIPTERVTLLFPLRVPGGEIREVTMRPVSDTEVDDYWAGKGSALEAVASAAGLAPALGLNLANVDLERLADASDRLRAQIIASREHAW